MEISESLIIKFTIRGDFRSGTELESFRNRVECITKTTDDKIYLDLVDVVYTDSGSFRLVLELENLGHEVEWDQDSYSYYRYLDYKDGRDLYDTRHSSLYYCCTYYYFYRSTYLRFGVLQ